MTALFVGWGNLLVGLAYLGLGLLSAWEAYSQFRYRGLSRFGLGFTMMAASCGPHHLVHGWCVLQTGIVTTPMVAATLLGLPAGVTFCVLRAEAMLGGRGDRTLMAPPRFMVAAGLAWLGLTGAAAGWALAAPAMPGWDVCTRVTVLAPNVGRALVSASNLFVVVTYGMVGWYLAATQIQRYAVHRTWSVSGVALSAVFPTCAAMHLIVALTGSQEVATLPFDLWGVPASVFFLWVVRQLHTDSAIDWNRRPLVGLAAAPGRPAPWNDVKTVR
jgi:hypothetical protein